MCDSTTMEDSRPWESYDHPNRRLHVISMSYVWVQDFLGTSCLHSTAAAGRDGPPNRCQNALKA